MVGIDIQSLATTIHNVTIFSNCLIHFLACQYPRFTHCDWLMCLLSFFLSIGSPSLFVFLLAVSLLRILGCLSCRFSPNLHFTFCILGVCLTCFPAFCVGQKLVVRFRDLLKLCSVLGGGSGQDYILDDTMFLYQETKCLVMSLL